MVFKGMSKGQEDTKKKEEYFKILFCKIAIIGREIHSYTNMLIIILEICCQNLDRHRNFVDVMSIKAVARSLRIHVSCHESQGLLGRKKLPKIMF